MTQGKCQDSKAGGSQVEPLGPASKNCKSFKRLRNEAARKFHEKNKLLLWQIEYDLDDELGNLKTRMQELQWTKLLFLTRQANQTMVYEFYSNIQGLNADKINYPVEIKFRGVKVDFSCETIERRLALTNDGEN